MNKDPISNAVARRLDDLSDRVGRLDSQAFGEMGFFLTSVKEGLRSNLPPFPMPEFWAAADTDSLTSIRVLSLHGSRIMRRDPAPPKNGFLDQLKQRATAREPLFELLTNRYAWPLNFSNEAEADVREYVLMCLMTNDRTRIETVSPAAVNIDDLLLKLNLTSIHASAASDLRFLDALNYYYELLPAHWHPETQHAWLLVSWYALYARALNSWL